MNPLTVIRDSLYFFQRNLSQIVTLCLPLVILEAVLQHLVDDAVGPDASPGYGFLVGLLLNPLYTAEALATGAGRNGHVRSSDGRIDLGLSVPEAMGGAGTGSNPEQLFAAGYAACFHSALQLVARTQKVDITDSSVGGQVQIGSNGKGGFELAVLLEVVLPGVEAVAAQALADAAHQVCPYSNATRGNVVVRLHVTV